MNKMNERFKWGNFNVENIEKKHEIREKAKRDAMGDEPTTKNLWINYFKDQKFNVKKVITQLDIEY